MVTSLALIIYINRWIIDSTSVLAPPHLFQTLRLQRPPPRIVRMPRPPRRQAPHPHPHPLPGNNIYYYVADKRWAETNALLLIYINENLRAECSFQFLQHCSQPWIFNRKYLERPFHILNFICLLPQGCKAFPLNTAAWVGYSRLCIYERLSLCKRKIMSNQHKVWMKQHNVGDGAR